MPEKQSEAQPQAEKNSAHGIISCLEYLQSGIGSWHLLRSVLREEFFSSKSPLGKPSPQCLSDHVGKAARDEKRYSQLPPIPANPNQSVIWLRSTTGNLPSSSDDHTQRTMATIAAIQGNEWMKVIQLAIGVVMCSRCVSPTQKFYFL